MDNELTDIGYMSGFGNEFATEGLEGALPVGQNSPQRAPYDLYAEVLSGTAFTAPRHLNRRTWMYRIRPSAVHSAFRPVDPGLWRGTPFAEVKVPPNRMRWEPMAMPDPSLPVDFIDGLITYAGNGCIERHIGCAAHMYTANASMQRVFCDRSEDR